MSIAEASVGAHSEGVDQVVLADLPRRQVWSDTPVRSVVSLEMPQAAHSDRMVTSDDAALVCRRALLGVVL